MTDPYCQRELRDHKVNPVNDQLTITVMDKPGAGGASHDYSINWTIEGPHYTSFNEVRIPFQNGPISEVGVNGVTQEALLAICADRLKGFQTGQYACEANAQALWYINAAQNALKKRTLERMDRGVEGTSQV